MTELSTRVVKFIRQRYGVEIARRWYREPFKVLVGCLLSQRTREENTEAACKALFAVASTPKQISGLSTPELQRLIKPAGLVKQKASNVKQICRILLKKHGGKVPANRELLMKLPGVGPKTADVTLCYGFGHPCIPVDVHVNRISKRLGLVEERAGVERVRETLQKTFPRKDWYLINRGFVLFGREICLPRNPRCDSCGLKNFCKSRR
jgi:endonuclease-3